MKDITAKFQQFWAWLFFFSIPIANAPALTFGALILMLLTSIVSAEKVRPPLSLLGIFAAYILVSTASLAWTFEPGATLTALKREVYIPTLIFFVFYCFRLPNSRSIVTAALGVGLVLITFVFMAESGALRQYVGSAIQHYNPGVGDFSTYAVLLLPILYWASHGSDGFDPRKTIGAIVGVLLIFYGGYLTKNRMFWPAASVTLLALFLIHLGGRERQWGARQVVSLSLVAAALISVSLVFAYVKYHGPSTASVDSQVETVVDKDPRWEIWSYWIRLVDVHPWLGYGYGRYIALRHSPVPQPEAARGYLSMGHGHNIFLNQASEIGIIGLVSFSLMWVLLWRQYWRHLRNPAIRHYAAAGLVLMIAYLMKNITDDFYTRRNLLLFWALNGLWLRSIHDHLRERVSSDLQTLQRILVIRRDNIGDLICTTPMIRQLRERFPTARIDALVNSYNRPVLDNNPDLDHVYEYTKGKHRRPGQQLLGVYWAKCRLFMTLYAQRYDLAILPGSGYAARGVRFARLIGARDVLGYFERERQKSAGLTLAVDIRPLGPMHEVEYGSVLLKPLGIESKPPQTLVVLAPEERRRAEEVVEAAGVSLAALSHGAIGVHISARKHSNRWPEEAFVRLIRALWQAESKPVLLFWAPGSSNDPRHPGDDEMAARIAAACSNVPLIAFATQNLRELMAGISLCESYICSDGGAMHIAAALHKPIVCFFGNSDARQWCPWGVSHRLLQPDSLHAGCITVDDVLTAYSDLRCSLKASEACSS
ncbi:glycosyltransferase family 9 protein [Mangrovitalea sediminis]|uniref:glycosyltransferase family 9 protein n=1 Tax=Mangrovitalea sediminis TaxID=1982043 RepID=UPI000BE4D8C6|nr:glycosyltransferase family 9 protein [Mangrovitalea sediminis]